MELSCAIARALAATAAHEQLWPLTVVLYGEMVLPDRGRKYGYFSGENPLEAGDWVLFGALLVYENARDAGECADRLSRTRGMMTNARFQERSGVQVFLNSAFESLVRDVMTCEANRGRGRDIRHVRLPVCTATDQRFPELLAHHAPLMCTVDSGTRLEGVVMVASSAYVAAVAASRRDVHDMEGVLKWKTAANDESHGEKRLLKLRSQLEAQERRARNHRDLLLPGGIQFQIQIPELAACVRTLLDAYLVAAASGRDDHAGGGGAGEDAVDLRLVELIANSALTKVDGAVLRDRTVPKHERVRVATTLSSEVVDEYMSAEPETGEALRPVIAKRAYAAIWNLACAKSPRKT